MATNSVTILFVIASVIANHTQTTCASEAVNVACKSLKLIPGEWRYDDRDVPLISQACNVTGSGSISLFDDIIDMAGAASINSGGFVSANIRLHCTSAADRISKWTIRFTVTFSLLVSRVMSGHICSHPGSCLDISVGIQGHVWTYPLTSRVIAGIAGRCECSMGPSCESSGTHGD